MYWQQHKRRCLLGVVGLVIIAFMAWLLWTPVRGVPILEYHMVGNDAQPEEQPYIVPTAEFAAQLDYLQEAGYTTITMQEYTAARQGKRTLPAKPIILTFDDGYADNYTEMLPVLEAHGMRATMYMVTNDIDRDRYLTWEQLRDMQQRGVEIGGHTANHLPLTTLSPEEQADELKLSKLILEWNGIHWVGAFSYPNGAYTPEIAQRVREAGYLTAVTGDAGLNTDTTDFYELQRINIPQPRLGLLEFRLRLLKGEIMTKLQLHQHNLQ